MFKFFAYLLFIPLLTVWLAFCASLALIGWVLPNKRLKADLEEVEARLTVCKVLNQKNLISDEEYAFETQKVAGHYDRLTFHGYLFIVKPVIALLRVSAFLDSFVLFLVKKWIGVHKFLFEQSQKPSLFYMHLANLCVGLAHRVGVFLHYSWQITKLRVEL